MKLFRKIDTTTGNFLEDVIFESHPTLVDGELDPQYIEEAPEQGLYKPKWDGDKWVEGATQEEIDELTKPQPHEPTVEERLAQTEELLKTVTMAFTEYVFTQGMSDDS